MSKLELHTIIGIAQQTQTQRKDKTMPIIVKISEKLSTQLLAYHRIPPHWSYERVSLCDNMWTKSVWEQLQKILAFEISEPIKIPPESRV